MAEASRFQFKVEGQVELVCPCGSGRTPEWVMVAVPVGEEFKEKEVPSVAVCGECEVVYGAKSGAAPSAGASPKEAFSTGVEIGEKVLDAVLKFAEILGGKKNGR